MSSPAPLVPPHITSIPAPALPHVQQERSQAVETVFLVTQAALLVSERPHTAHLAQQTINMIVLHTPALLPVPRSNTKMTLQLPTHVNLVIQPALLAMEAPLLTAFPALMALILSLHHQELARHLALHIIMEILLLTSAWDVTLLVLLVLELWLQPVRPATPISTSMAPPVYPPAQPQVFSSDQPVNRAIPTA